MQMTNRVLETNALAEVTVVFPPKTHVEVMRAFGLMPDDKTN